MHILVTGATGALGRDVVKVLLERRHKVRILSRKAATSSDWVQGDLATGAGLETAVTGIDAIVHAGSATTQWSKLHETDVVGTRRLLAMAREAGVRHTVYISIVGMEGVASYPYYRSKLAAEQVVREGIVPWSILRATQFHTLMETFMKGMTVLPRLAMVPYTWQFQPVDTHDVAARLADVAAAEPAGVLPDFGGPEVRDFKSIAVSWLQARRLNKRLVNLWLPLKFSAQVAEGKLLCPAHMDGTVTFEEYLDRRYPKQP
jgi:uncharacterized protein YbjT (DUF2867 family)